MKNIPALLLAVTVFVTIPSISFGEMHDGNILLEDCNQFLKYMENKEDSSVAMASIGYCLGYMQGHIDFQQHITEKLNHNMEHCIPIDISVSQLAKVAVDYLKNNPQTLNKPAIEITLAAFAETFPCTNTLSQSSR